MKIKKQLKKYVNSMEIPEASKILPDDTDIKQEHRKTHIRKAWIYSGGGIAAACLAGIIILNTVQNDYNKTASEDKNFSMEVCDGVIGGSLKNDMEYDGKELEDSMLSGSIAEVMGEVDAAGDSSYGIVMTDDVITGDIITGIDTEQYMAGTLTGGEIRDLMNWDNWLKKADKDVLNWWGFSINERISVFLHNGNEPLNNYRITLYRGQEIVYKSVTDINGNAYLFTMGDVKASECDTLEIKGNNGDTVQYRISECMNPRNEIDIDFEGANGEIKLDLMFMIDTTGSMGDELEYLKAELKNVVTTVNKETGIPIRTSVNFYRDEGDDYIVKYYDFRNDITEVTGIIDTQSAAGGGDGPEAVHKALDNAVNMHNWAEDSTVRLMFLVLDAPPHDDNEIKSEIAGLIKKASSEGIRIIPVAASGADEQTQQMLRTYAIMTGGTYVFLDNNSGVGGTHTLPVDEKEYNSEYLNDMLVRIISEYCGKEGITHVVEYPHDDEAGNKN